ncbi:GtrA family protein [Paenibacillus hamazuiensis]|uniref:GtrA family protein n=1 Tax=Paenibacillus hamazuiensis TaxID=2936508 RepID=UPI00200E5540|nr:GtrA family protein [Paenibacillus hamazuiensis]
MKRPSLPAIRQLLKFNAVGVANTLLDMAVYALLVWTGVPYYFAQTVSYSCGIVNSYYLNKRWTFGQTEAAKTPNRSFVKFAALNAFSLAVSLLCLHIFMAQFGLSNTASKIGTTLLTMGITFAGSKLWVFSSRGGRGLE